MRCVYRTGIVRGPWRSTISSPSACRLEHERRAAAAAVPVDPVEAVLALLGGHREVDDRGRAQWRPIRATSGSSALRTAVPGARHRLDDDALDVGQLAERVDAAEAQVVAGDVGDDGDVVAVVAQALAQDAAAGDLEHGRVDGRVLEDHLGRLRARTCRRA